MFNYFNIGRHYRNIFYDCSETFVERSISYDYQNNKIKRWDKTNRF